MSAIKNAVLWIAANTGIDEMLLEAARAFIATSIAVALGLGIPLLDISGNDFRTVVSAGLAACLQVVVRALNPEDAKFGVGKAKVAKAEEKAAAESTAHITGSAIDTDGDGIADELAGTLANEDHAELQNLEDDGHQG
jgi:hypothetical protein